MRPGKFDSDLDEAIWEASHDSGTDAEAGSVAELGLWSGLLREGESLADVIASNNPELDVSKLREEGAAGVIVTEDDQGFVKVYYYDDSIALEQAWAETEEEAEPQEEDGDFEPNNPGKIVFVDREGGWNYAYRLEGVSSGVPNWQIIKDFKADAKSDWISAKVRDGKKAITEIKRWVRAVNPREFFVQWPSNVDDDSLKVYYKSAHGFESNRADLRRGSIQEALSYVHYWERRERGKDQMDRAEAAKAAIRISGLNDAEADVLLNALHVSRSEIAAARNPRETKAHHFAVNPDGFGEHSLPLVERHLPASALSYWRKQLPMMSRVAFLTKHHVPRSVINQVEDDWKQWRAHPAQLAANPEKPLYAAIVEAGLPIDHHESDLYILDSPEARALLKQYDERFSTFRSEVDGKTWIDVAFGYTPFWEKKQERNLPGIDFGDPYGDGFLTPQGKRIQMWRKGQRVRFYDEQNRQVGPEQRNVAPAIAYALQQGWVAPGERIPLRTTSLGQRVYLGHTFPPSGPSEQSQRCKLCGEHLEDIKAGEYCPASGLP